MDSFTKNALLIMTGLLVTMVVSTYVGAVVYKGDMQTRYTEVMEEEAEAAHLSPAHVVELDKTGEYIGFTIAGALGGLLIGYLWPSVFKEEK